jgi:hypothetical protein
MTNPVTGCLSCPAGYYCPIGSTEPYQYPCGKGPAKYCPEGSAYAHAVEEGYYAVAPVEYADLSVTMGGEAVISSSYSSELGELAGYSASAICPAGSYCWAGVRILLSYCSSFPSLSLLNHLLLPACIL